MTIEWLEYTPEVQQTRLLLHEVLVFDGRWCGHQTKLISEDGYREMRTLCGKFVAGAGYVNNWSHYGWDWDGPPTETFGIYEPPSGWAPPLCKRCFP